MATQKRPWRFMIEGAAVGFILTALMLLAVPRMLREQQRYASHHPDHSASTITRTGDPFHIAINGRGYFEFELPDGEKCYSRMSEFKSGQSGLVSLHGYPVTRSQTGGLNISAEIWADGTINKQDSILKTTNNSGFLTLFLFEHPNRLTDIGDGYYKPNSASGKPVEVKPFGYTGGGFLLQGWKLERTSHYRTPPHQLVNEKHNGPRDYPNEPIIESGAVNSYAIDGRGFAAVLLPDGRLGYTRVLNLAQTPQGHVVRAFPPTKPYKKFVYAGGLEKMQSASYPFLVGLPIVRLIIEESQPGPLAVRADPFAFAQPLKDQEETITISMQHGVQRGHDLYAFKDRSGVWHALMPSPQQGVNSVDDFTILTNELGRPFHIPRAEYLSSMDKIESIQLYDFKNPGSLQYRLNGVYAPTDRSGPPTPLSTQDAGKLKRGYINQVEAIEP